MSVIVTADVGQRMRADAIRNRERIIAAARDALVEFGPDVALDAIAHRAGVGNATVYRHFADRHELLVQVTMSALDRITAHAETAVTDGGDAFEALREFVHRVADERIGSLCSLICGDFGADARRIDAARARLESAVDRVMERAHAAGQLRPDVERGDLLVAITQLTRPPAGAKVMGFERFVHRHLDLFLDGLHAPGRSPLPGSAATLEDLQGLAT